MLAVDDAVYIGSLAHVQCRASWKNVLGILQSLGIFLSRTVGTLFEESDQICNSGALEYNYELSTFRLRILCVEWDVKPYTLTHILR